jgi:hypothetical protein
MSGRTGCRTENCRGYAQHPQTICRHCVSGTPLTGSPVRIGHQYINLSVMSAPQLDLLVAHIEQERMNRESTVTNAPRTTTGAPRTTAVVAPPASRFEKPTECAICCDDESAPKLMVLKPCDHWICSDCFDRGNCVECPFCRVKLDMPENVRRKHVDGNRRRQNEVLEEYSRNLFGGGRRRQRSRSPSPQPVRRRVRVNHLIDLSGDEEEEVRLSPSEFRRMFPSIFRA